MKEYNLQTSAYFYFVRGKKTEINLWERPKRKNERGTRGSLRRPGTKSERTEESEYSGEQCAKDRNLDESV